MSDEKHAGTGRYCGECMHLLMVENETGCFGYRSEVDGGNGAWCYHVPGDGACMGFTPSIAAQQLEQSQVANSIALMQVRATIISCLVPSEASAAEAHSLVAAIEGMVPIMEKAVHGVDAAPCDECGSIAGAHFGSCSQGSGY